jgi:tetratricopeptide (TPR) repeat protein
VGSARREPPPPGPIAEFFDRLDDLHSKAGRPSTREIAKRAGHNVSHSTVHNIFTGSRVPRWDYLEIIVGVLGGRPRRDEFHALWDAAWMAQSDARMSGDNPADAAQPPGRPAERSRRPVQPAAISKGIRMPPRPSQRIWSNEIPPRNRNFTGRMTELETLGRNLDTQESPCVQVISGMGGVGKTELATEYLHRNIDRYEIIWWIRAEHHDRVRQALVYLGWRLEPGLAGTDSSRDRSIAAALEKLRSEAGPSWLIVYDNVDNPFDLGRYLPASRPGGHIIVTLRQRNWPTSPKADLIEVSPFTEAEAISFLRHRVPSLAAQAGRAALAQEENARRAAEAARLAAELGYLPIAIDHAAAYLTETARSVDEYLARFAQNAHTLVKERHGGSEPHDHVSGTWELSNELLTDDAKHLFNLCAFFSPEPIAAKLFLQDAAGIDEPPGLAEVLSSTPRFRAAESQLHRLSLAKVDAARDVIQMHRVVQAVTQGRLREDHTDQFQAYRAAVDALLAKSNPGNPDHSGSDAVYDLSLQHLESDYRFLHTANPALRDLIIDQVRRLHLRGAHVEAMQFGQDALEVWRERHGEDELKVLTLAVEVAVAMYRGDRIADAHDLIGQIRPFLEPYSEGVGFKVFLLCESIYGAILRARSEFRDALDRDRRLLTNFEIAFGEMHERTLNVRSNVALGYRLLGNFGRALEFDRRTYQDRCEVLGEDDPQTLFSHNAVARDLRGLGKYQESLDIARDVANAFDEAGGRENTQWLTASEQFATALRKAGHHWDALQQREHVLQRYLDYLGDDHIDTLTAATNLINDRRAVGDLTGAEELARETLSRCQEFSTPHDLLCAAQLNLASVLRAMGSTEEALANDRQATNGLMRIYGDLHPFTLAASINYASDLAECGRLGEAIQLGHETLDKCRRSLGDSHPDTLMAAANLSFDEAAAGDGATAEQQLTEILIKYAQTLTLEHPEARAAVQRTRLTAEIEPVPA